MNLHERAVSLVKEYQRVESELVETLRLIDDRKLFRKHGATSLFVYATKVLRLSESVAWNFITVARATKKSPVLKAAIAHGELSVSKARRITSILTLENQVEWVERAKTLSQRKLEKAVAKENPKAITPDCASYITDDFMKLEIGLSEQEMEELKHVQDLVCQSKQTPASLRETILEAIRFYRKHKDPVEKAKRARQIPAVKPDSSQVLHAVARRDQNQCTGTNPDGSRCENRRWLDVHHIIPKAKGGPDSLENLKTLCRAHHQIEHVIEGFR